MKTQKTFTKLTIMDFTFGVREYEMYSTFQKGLIVINKILFEPEKYNGNN